MCRRTKVKRLVVGQHWTLKVVIRHDRFSKKKVPQQVNYEKNIWSFWTETIYCMTSNFWGKSYTYESFRKHTVSEDLDDWKLFKDFLSTACTKNMTTPFSSNIWTKKYTIPFFFSGLAANEQMKRDLEAKLNMTTKIRNISTSLLLTTVKESRTLFLEIKSYSRHNFILKLLDEP